MKLLSLLQNRALYRPEQWARYDNLCLDFPWKKHKVELQYTDLWMIMYGLSYGTLVGWNDAPIHRGELLGFPRAIILLELQATLYGFLREATAQLVQGSTPGSSDAELFQLEFKSFGRNDLWSTYTNQPYPPPPKFGIDSMLLKARARLNMSSDHLWLLQTDAHYLRREIGLILNGTPKGLPRTRKYNEVALILPQGIWNYWSWAFIVKACENVKDMQEAFADSVRPGQPLPRELEEVLQELDAILNAYTSTCSSSLWKALSSRDEFKDFYDIKEEEDKRHILLRVQYELEDYPKKDPLFYVLETLLSPRALPGVQLKWPQDGPSSRIIYQPPKNNRPRGSMKTCIAATMTSRQPMSFNSP
jgi:hypothetical protein